MKSPSTLTKAAATLLLTASLSAPASAVTVDLQPLHPHAVPSASVALISGCAKPNTGAAIDGTPFFELPSIAAAQGATGTAGIAIALSPQGRLVSESVLQSSGNPNLDRAALLSARMTRFTPEIANCAKVGGSYLYTVTF